MSPKSPPELPPVREIVRSAVRGQTSAQPTHRSKRIEVLRESGLIESLTLDLIIETDQFLQALKQSNKDKFPLFIEKVRSKAVQDAFSLPTVGSLFQCSSGFDKLKMLLGTPNFTNINNMGRAILWHLTGRTDPTDIDVEKGIVAYLNAHQDEFRTSDISSLDTHNGALFDMDDLPSPRR